MPELPEVETVRRGLEPLLLGQRIVAIQCRVAKLRLPLDENLSAQLVDRKIEALERRAKYLLLRLDRGTLLLHLGMSGVLRLIDAAQPAQKHDHVDLFFASGKVLRFHDPRRFGLLLYLSGDPFENPLLRHLGVEPFADDLPVDYLFATSRRRRLAIKNFIMDQKVLVGVGNIYASEALFAAGIHPQRMAKKLTRNEAIRLLAAIRAILAEAIAAGGTSLKDFRREDGKPGYFQQQLLVYGRKGECCVNCESAIQQIVLGQRSSYFCSQCQQ